MFAVRCNRLSKMLGEKQILKSVGFEVSPGDIFGYLGPNGAGKTTTIRILLGLLPRTFGELSILGHDEPGAPELQRQIGFVLDADGLYDNLTALENLDYYGQLYTISDSRRRCDEVLELVGLTDRAKDRVKVFSTGMRQRLALARAILHKPRLLILDEPTSGVDPTGQAEVRELIRELAQQGTTIFLSSHNLDEVQRTCNRVAFIKDGRIRLAGAMEQLMASPQRRIVIHFEAQPPRAAIADLAEVGQPDSSGMPPTQVCLELKSDVSTSAVVSQLVAAGARIESVQRDDQSLAQLYAKVMQEVEQ